MSETLLKDRGITDETAKRFGVWRDTDTWCFPYPNGGKKYRAEQNGKRKFWFDGKLGLFRSMDAVFEDYPTVICEGETDTMRLHQQSGGSFNVYGLPGVQSWQNDWQVKGNEVFVVLDNGTPEYGKPDDVENGWLRIRKTYPKAMRIYLPDEVKDICEYFDLYDAEHFQGLMQEARDRKPTFHYKALDLSVDPPAPDWLVENMIAKGDLVILMGEPNVGKSFLTMDLGVRIAEGSAFWLGHKVYAHNNRVLFIDEENPLDVVYNRLRRLGMTDDGSQNIRYLLNQGVRLDKNPQRVLEEAAAFSPDLIVVDSLTRMHSKNENSAGEINALFNEALKPLARETNAAVVFLHHAGKSESNSSFNKSRGSSDIIAAPDGGFELRQTAGEPGRERMNLINFKTRRGTRHRGIPLTIRDIDDKIVISVIDDGFDPGEEPF